MSDLIKTAIIAGVVHKVLSKKENSDKNENNIRYSSSQSESVPNKKIDIFFAVFFSTFGIAFLIIGETIKGLGLSIGIGIVFILYALMLYFGRIKKTT